MPSSALTPSTFPAEKPELEALLRLHAANEVDALWSGVRDLLRANVRFHRLTLFLGHLGLREARLVFSDPPVEESPEWFARRARGNPFSAWIARNPGVPFYRFEDIVGPPATFRQSDFYRDFAKPEGWDKGLSVLFWQGGSEMRAMFSLYRSPRQRPFSEEDIQRLATLAPHIETAIMRVQDLHEERQMRRVLEAFNRDLPLPLLLMDWEHRVVFANHEAQRVAALWNYGAERARHFNSRECFRVPASILEAARSMKEQMLQDAARIPPVRLRHPEDPRLEATLQLSPGRAKTLSHPGYFVLFRHHREEETSEDIEEPSQRRLRLLAELTPAERELALLVCEGLTNREIAERLRKSILTVKTQLNSVFQKLEVKSRARLIHKLR